MALHRLMEMEVGVPDPAALDDFYQEIGFSGEKGVWGSATYPGQIKISEASYRQLKYIKMACEDEADIAAIKARLDEIGVAYEHSNGTLQVTDPINQWIPTGAYIFEEIHPAQLLGLRHGGSKIGIASVNSTFQ